MGDQIKITEYSGPIQVDFRGSALPIKITAIGIGRDTAIAGGTTAQVLNKLSNADYDVAWHTLVKADVGLGNVDNTSDINKPVSTAQTAAIAVETARATTAEALLVKQDGSTAFTNPQVGVTPTLANQLTTKSYVDAVFTAVTGALVFKGAWDASAGTFPGASVAQLGWFYKVSVAGTVNGVPFGVGDDVYAIVNNASTSTYAANWLKIQGNLTSAEIATALGYTPVQSVNSQTGASITLTTTDIAEGTNLYHTAARVNALISASVGSVTQAWSATLDLLAAVSTTSFGRSLLSLTNAAGLRSAAALGTAAQNNTGDFDAAGAAASAQAYAVQRANHTGVQAVGTVTGLATSTTAGRLARFTNTAGSQGQTTGVFEDGSGNVGIGTTTPSQALDVNGAIISSAGMYPSGGSLAFGVVGGLAGVYASGGANLLYYNGLAVTSALNWGATGNVGIGTQAQVCALDVVGPVRTRPVTVGTLPSAALGAGMRHFVTDALTTVILGLGTVVAAGGSNEVPVYSAGGNWYYGG